LKAFCGYLFNVQKTHHFLFLLDISVGIIKQINSLKVKNTKIETHSRENQNEE